MSEEQKTSEDSAQSACNGLLGKRIKIISESAWNGEEGIVKRLMPEVNGVDVALDSGLNIAFFIDEIVIV